MVVNIGIEKQATLYKKAGMETETFPKSPEAFQNPPVGL